jgi:hypothetical protein
MLSLHSSVSFGMQKLFIQMMQPHLSIFAFVVVFWGPGQEIIAQTNVIKFFPFVFFYKPYVFKF